jgi:hypothetical protein
MPLDQLTGKNATIVHFHVGKTGGTALNSLMQNCFPGRCSIQQEPDEPPQRSDAPIAYMSGHWPPALYLRNFAGGDYCRILLLRHPLFMFASNYRQIIKDLNFGRSPLGMNVPESMTDMVRTIREWFENDIECKHVARRYFDNVQLRFILGRDIGRISSTDVHQAIDLLGEIDIIGITERFHQLYRLLAFRFNDVGSHRPEMVNFSGSVSQDYTSLDQGDMRYLMELCSYD